MILENPNIPTMSWHVMAMEEKKLEVPIFGRFGVSPFCRVHMFFFSNLTCSDAQKVQGALDFFKPVHFSAYPHALCSAERSWCLSGAAEPRDQVHYWMLSVFHPSVVNFSHFQLLWNRWTELNETWLEATSQHHLTSFVIFGPIGKTRWPSWPLIWLKTFSTSLKPLNGSQWNLTGSNISTSSTKLVFFGLIGKIRWSPWCLIGWDIFNLSETTVRSQRPLPSLYFWADQNSKMAALASDWPRHFRLLLWNHWTEVNETWQEATF